MELDFLYIASIEHVFNVTNFDVAYLTDGDLLIGKKRNLSKLLHTDKQPHEVVSLLNFRGSLKYLLGNGKANQAPFVIRIAPNWYVVKDIQLL